jgi:hypothetical protein
MSSRYQHHKQSTGFSKRKRVRTILICGVIFLALFSWGFSLVRFISLDPFNIDRVQISGIDPSLTTALEAAVLDSMKGDYLGLLPKSSTFLYPKKAIENVIKLAVPSVDSVSISRLGGNELDISIKEKDPAAIICTDYPDFSGADTSETGFQIGNDDSCYYVDTNALIFKKAPAITGDAYHRYFVPGLVDNESSTTDVIGMYATSTDEFNRLQKFYTNVADDGITADAILVKDTGEYELYIGNPDVVVIYFNNARPFNDQLANLLSFWTTMNSPSRTKAATTTFDYIDVRYGANVFYK